MNGGGIERAEIFHRIGLANVIWLELLHSRGYEKNGWVIGDERRRGYYLVPPLFKKFEKFFSDLVMRHPYNLPNMLNSYFLTPNSLSPTL